MFGLMTDRPDDPIPPPPWRTVPRAAATRAPLSQAAIVDAALKIVDADGVSAVSMRRVADALGTGAASLYQHVSGKDELLDLVLDRVAGEVELPAAPDPERWQEQLRELMTGSWRALRAHPGIASVAIANIPTGPNALAMTEALLGILRAGRLPPQACAWATDNLYKFVTADAFEESIYLARGQSEEDDPFAHLQAYFASLPAERFPHLTSMFDELMAGDSEERFAFGLDLMIRGLATYRPSS
jgi:AcrR family transcriptional regulator